jgi:A/G-specific adenine glycosylase
MASEAPGEVNEALMELGAMVCSPGEPRCGECPLEHECTARALGLQHAIPTPRRRRAVVSVRWVAACLVDGNGRWLVKRVDEGPILRGLWLPPLAEVEDRVAPESTAASLCPLEPPPPGTVFLPVRHNITHRKIDVIPVRFDAESFDPPTGRWAWVDPEDPGVPTSSLLQKLVKSLRT